ncbi:ankyrin repeat-containing domain protein, partial [Cryomyces antarcticus]
RPHRRTASMQSSLPEAHSHKKRRVMPTLGEKLVQSWDSDGSSSDSSTTVPRSVITRGSHRAVSTPGRSMPQAKRRVDYHGLTKLAKACEKGPLEAVQAALENDPGALDIADNDGNTPLQHVSLHGHKDIVEFLIGKNCRLDTFNISKHDTPLIDAVENSETDIVRVLLDAGVDPHCQNLEGNQPLDLLPDDDTKDEIEELLRAAIRKASAKSGSRPPLKHEQSVSQQPTAGPNLLYLDPNTKNLYKMAQIGDDKTVSEWIGRARVAPDHSCVKVAARGGHIICVRHLLAHIGEKDYEQYMLATIGRGHHAMVEFFIQQDDFDPTQRSEQTGKTYFEIAEERQGPNWQEERDALKDAYDKYIATH